MKKVAFGMGALVALTLMTAGGVLADECTQECREEARECRTEARDAKRMCAEEEGCDVLLDDYRAICQEEGRGSDTCREARAALRECFAPCRDAGRDLRSECGEDLETCLVDECGREPRPARPGRFRR